MDPADAADGRRRTQAWMGPPIAPTSQAPQRSLRWMPNPNELPSYPNQPHQPNQPDMSSPAPVAVASASALHPGALVGGRYRLVRRLGEGRLTETWEATHVDLERAVAIKFLRQAEAGMAERMVEEARTVARVRHPHVLEFNDFGRTEIGEPFFVMELLAGQTVEQLLARRGVIPWARAVAIVQQVAEALGAAHQHGIVHRDLRPGNVFLVDTGQVGDFAKVVDFGLARGTTMGGTPGYMSPEQCRGEQLDPRSDVYAIGCLLFAMVTGDPPFVGEPQRVAWQQINEAPKTLRERAPRQFIPDELEAIVARCLAKLPAQRFADTRELAAELAALAQFSAAASMVGAPSQDPSASGSRPMGFAGRPPPKSPRELTNSYKPVNQPIVDDAPGEPPRASPSSRAGPPTSRKTTPGMSAPAIVAATLAGVVAVVGFGVGMYVLVNRLIADDSPAKSPPAAAEARPESTRANQPLSEPMRAAAGTTAGPAPAKLEPAEEVAPAVVEPSSVSEAEASEPAGPPQSPTRSAKKSGKHSSDPAPQPPPEPEPAPEQPEPEPKPKPKKSKPSVEPDSKAKDKIGHEELLDPWG